jgi:hypothetical protein
MAKLSYEFVNQVSIILGIIVMILAWFSDFPPWSNVILLYLMPVLLYTNYVALIWLEDHDKR